LEEAKRNGHQGKRDAGRAITNLGFRLKRGIGPWVIRERCGANGNSQSTRILRGLRGGGSKRGQGRGEGKAALRRGVGCTRFWFPPAHAGCNVKPSKMTCCNRQSRKKTAKKRGGGVAG